MGRTYCMNGFLFFFLQMISSELKYETEPRNNALEIFQIIAHEHNFL